MTLVSRARAGGQSWLYELTHAAGRRAVSYDARVRAILTIQLRTSVSFPVCILLRMYYCTAASERGRDGY